MNKYEEIYQLFLEDKKMTDKYFEAGIYAIFAVLGKGDSQTENRKLLYIGQSKNMLHRIAAHYTHIEYPYNKESYQHKYNIIRLFLQCGYQIQFDVLSYNSTSLLDWAEGEWIRKYNPPLNYQIPKAEGGYTVNKKAKTITVKEILEQ